MLRAVVTVVTRKPLSCRSATWGQIAHSLQRISTDMMPDTDFAKLVSAMLHDDIEWRWLDRQIRSMNKKLAQWRRARYSGATYALTQRTAFEVLATMQAIYDVVEKPRVPQPAIGQKQPEPQPQSTVFDELWTNDSGELIAAVIGYVGQELVAAPDYASADVVLNVSAAA
jgi:hypothetical protein